MMYDPSHAPAPDDLLLTAREALKAALRNGEADHHYTILMAMNAMGIAARAMRTDPPPPACPGASDDAFRSWIRRAGEDAVTNPELVDNLRRHVWHKLAVSNPRFKPWPVGDDS